MKTGYARVSTKDQNLSPYSSWRPAAKDICGHLGVSRSTLYRYLRHEGVEIGSYA